MIDDKTPCQPAVRPPARRMGSRSTASTRGALMLAADAIDQLSGRTHEFHRAISDMPFAVLNLIPGVNLGSRATRVLHDGITDGVYSLLRSGARTLFSGADLLARNIEFKRARAPALSAASLTPLHADNLASILSGFVGDRMARKRNPLAIRMGIYRNAERVRLDAFGLRAGFPDAQPRIAVFLHGLCGNEKVWDLFQEPDATPSQSYGARLARDLGYTPVFLRYNTGLHVSLNGRSLSRLLNKLHQNWPVQAREIVLIGHSMGGLLARSAADTGAAAGAPWVSALRNVICLGTPHLGAPLERWVHLATHSMQKLALTRPIAKVLDSRSLGIKDLRWGYTQDREWKQRDPDAFWARDRMQYAALPGVNYRFMGTCLTRDPEHPLSRVIGDGLVPLPSSLATEVANAQGSLRVALHHMQLLNHPDVYAQIFRWLSPPLVAMQTC